MTSSYKCPIDLSTHAVMIYLIQVLSDTCSNDVISVDLCWQTWTRTFIHIVTFTPLVLFLCYYRNLIVFKIIWNWTVCITKPPSYEISLLKKKNICVTLYLFIFVILSLLILLILLFLCDRYGCNQKIFLNNYVKEISLKKSVRECCKLKKLERIKMI